MAYYETLDGIVKGVLLKRGYPLHYYLQFLISARDIVQTMAYDDGLITPNTALITLDNNAAGILPNDFIDITKVGVRNGQLVKPLVRQSSINRLPNVDSTGTPIPYKGNYVQGYIPGMYYDTACFNEYGEYTGRNYGAGAGMQTDTYKIIAERGVIQCNESLANCTIVVEFVSNGCDQICTVGVHPYAKDTIESYIIFDYTKNKRGSNLGEIQLTEQNHIKHRKIFRARKSELGIQEIKRLLIDAYYASPKI